MLLGTLPQLKDSNQGIDHPHHGFGNALDHITSEGLAADERASTYGASKRYDSRSCSFSSSLSSRKTFFSQPFGGTGHATASLYSIQVDDSTIVRSSFAEQKCLNTWPLCPPTEMLHLTTTAY